MATWLVVNRKALPPAMVAAWRGQLLWIFILNAFITFSIPSISRGAHFGGGIVGLLAAIPMDYLRFGSRTQRWAAIAGLVAIPVISISWMMRTLNEHAADIHGPEPDASAREALEGATEIPKYLEDEVKPLLDERPSRRDPAAVKDALANLTERSALLAQAAAIIKRSGPQRNEAANKLRRTLLLYLDAIAELVETIKRCLEQGDRWTPQDERKLQSQWQQVTDLEEQLH
jgi:hypothetical protein